MAYLNKDDLDPDPFKQFDQWYRAVEESGAPQWDAMTLATASPDARPSARVVLLKSFDHNGFVFFTNYDSRKSSELKQNPIAALLFWWPTSDKQIRVEGKVGFVTENESDEYFATRPREKQIGAWASNQSQVIEGREPLEERVAELEQQYQGKAVPRPPYWGGFRLVPSQFEFWLGQPDRLHDRIRYHRERGRWVIERLSP